MRRRREANSASRKKRPALIPAPVKPPTATPTAMPATAPPTAPPPGGEPEPVHAVDAVDDPEAKRPRVEL
jgi:hypothetical protein